MFFDDFEIQLILNRRARAYMYVHKPKCWKEEFICELLRWFEEKVDAIKTRKNKSGSAELEWKDHYEQMFRILYYAVITCNIRDYDSLKKFFRYFFEVEDDDPYRDDPDMISAEKLLKVYNYIVKNIGKFYRNGDRCDFDIIWPFCGRWFTLEMKDLEENMALRVIDGKIDRMSIGYRTKLKEKHVDETMERDVRFLQAVLDRMQDRVSKYLKEK